jgi:hypothetical protein
MYSKTFYKRNGESFTISVDDKNKHLLEEHSWFLRNGYAARTDKRKKSIYLHRVIMKRTLKRKEKKYGKSPKISFKDGNKLNCTKENIIFLKDKKKKKSKTTKLTSKYRGISFNSAKMMWRAKIVRKKTVLFDEFYETEKGALEALNEAKMSINKEIEEQKISDIKIIKIEDWDGPSNHKRKRRKRRKSNDEVITEKVYKTEEFDNYFDMYFKEKKASGS